MPNKEPKLNEPESMMRVDVTLRYAEHSDGINAIYTFQAYANNGELLKNFHAEANSLTDAANAFARAIEKAETIDGDDPVRSGE
jgi:hypothetical protein